MDLVFFLTRGDHGWEPASGDARIRGERGGLSLAGGRLGREFVGLLGIEHDYVVGNEATGPGSTSSSSSSSRSRRMRGHGHAFHHHFRAVPAAPAAKA